MFQHSIAPKNELRAHFRARRAELSAPRREVGAQGVVYRLCERWPDIISARGALAVYLASQHELNLSSMIETLLRFGSPVVAPQDEGFALLNSLHNLTHDARGIAQPDGEAVNINEIGLFLVPGLAFDATGARLGQGGGWYDRLLAHKNADALCIGVAFEEQIAATLPRESHDVAMDFIVTPQRWVDCRSTVEIEAARQSGDWEPFDDSI